MEMNANILQVPAAQNQWRERVELAAPLAIFLTSVMLGFLSSRWLGEGYASLIFVLGISVIGAVSGLSVAVVSALASAFVFNFLVAEPDFEFRFDRPSDFAPPIIFVLCAVVSGYLSGRLKDEAVHARQSAMRLEYLLDASRAMQLANTSKDIIDALQASSIGQSGIAFGLFEHDGKACLPVGTNTLPAPWQEIGEAILAQDLDKARNGDLAGFRLKGNNDAVGVLVWQTPPDQVLEERFMLSLANIVGLALERAHLVSQVFEVRAAARAEEFKTSLLSSVSHDMRTPMTTIRTAASSLLTFGKEFDEETSSELLGGIVEECDRLNHLTTNLLEMSRLQGGTDGLRLTVLPVGEILHSLAARLQGPQESSRITAHAPRDEVLINVDPTLFELALANIVQNALLYSPADSQVTIACKVEGVDCAISVTDTGKGIPKDQQLMVFKRFYRGDATRGAPKGTGLGLAIAKGFVEASHGEIAIISPVQDGRGTTITLRLPLAESQTFAQPEAA